MQICKSADDRPGQEIRRIVDSATIMEWNLLEKIRKAARLQNEVAAYEPRIKEVKDAIIAAAFDNGDLSEEGSVTYIVDGVLCRVSSGYDYSIPEASIPALREALGDDFYKHAERHTVFTPTQRLIEMACDGDRAFNKVRGLVNIRLRAPQVSIVQESPKEDGVG